jgi:hypothetical protein
MKLKISEGADPNYLATVVSCPELKEHPNAERLQLATVFGNDVIVAKDMYDKGEKLIYFPVECCIDRKFLSWANLLDKAELNADGKTKGFFGKHSRVKAVRLREIPSQGFLYKVSKLSEYYGIEENAFSVGDIFDTVGDDLLVTKYVRKESNSGEQNVKKSRVPRWLNSTLGVLPRPIRRGAYTFVNAWFNRNSEGIKSQIVDGQFKFHYKTENGGRNLFMINPDDYIIISEKLHGANGIYANVLCKKPFNPFRNIVNFFGASFLDKEYKFIYSSRNVIKNRRDGKYTDDIWGKIAERLDGRIPENITLYGELIGWSSTGRNVQKDYDYSVTRGDVDFRAFRAVRNNSDGSKTELPWDEMTEICDTVGVDWVPVHYKGLANGLFNLPLDKNWHDDFLSKLKKTYFKDQCEFCVNRVVNEGIVIRNESSPHKVALKFKSPVFLVKESSDRDNNEENIDEDN